MSSPADIEMPLRTLMLAALDGDQRAYRSLLELLRDRLVRYYSARLGPALAGNCDDLVQETLMAIHTRRITYD
ncbi:MAG TPA: RNA polymerase subunit sigma-70, partial [Devosia sp.]